MAFCAWARLANGCAKLPSLESLPLVDTKNPDAGDLAAGAVGSSKALVSATFAAIASLGRSLSKAIELRPMTGKLKTMTVATERLKRLLNRDLRYSDLLWPANPIHPAARAGARMVVDFRETLVPTCAAICRAANSAPKMNRIAGPKLLADAGPTKYNPATED